MSDMKDISLPQKLTNDYKVNINIDELSKIIEKLGTINTQLSETMLNSSMNNISSNDLSLITNDFSKPKNKIMNSKILPEIVQSIKILKVLPHFKESTLLYRWTRDIQSNEAFHQACDD